jgi:arylsulfatase A-like enzyme
VKITGYLTDEITQRSADFIKRNKAKPFFLMITYNAPHVPLQATRQQLAANADIADPTVRLYRTVIDAEDRGIGLIRKTLAAASLTQKTLVVFVSDNGCPDYMAQACTNYPLNGFKRFMTEGGTRVPMMMAWPGHLKPGRTFAPAVTTLDFYPTLRALAGGTADAQRPTDGVDLMPYLTGTASGSPHEYLYWRSLPSWAIRDERWKLLVNASQDGKSDVEMLFDLTNDPREKNDLAAAHPEIVERLKIAWRAWSGTLAAPRWPTDREFNVTINGRRVKIVD